jgi:hypothetical protein
VPLLLVRLLRLSGGPSARHAILTADARPAKLRLLSDSGRGVRPAARAAVGKRRRRA